MVNATYSGYNPTQINHEEDSLYRQAFASLIPVVGLISSLMNQYTLKNKIQATNENHDINGVVKLIELKNTYKWTTIPNSILTTALLVAAVVLGVGIFKVTFFLVCVGVWAFYNVQAVSQNKQLIDEHKEHHKLNNRINTDLHARLK